MMRTATSIRRPGVVRGGGAGLRRGQHRHGPGGQYTSLLTTFTPPGVEEGYTMVRAYVVAAEGEGYTVEALGGRLWPRQHRLFRGGAAHGGRDRPLRRSWQFSVYDLTDGHASGTLPFTEAAAKLADGREVSVSGQKRRALSPRSWTRGPKSPTRSFGRRTRSCFTPPAMGSRWTAAAKF